MNNKYYNATSAPRRGTLERQTTYRRFPYYKKFSRQDLLNPGRLGYNNLPEDIQFFIKFQRKGKSSFQLCWGSNDLEKWRILQQTQ